MSPLKLFISLLLILPALLATAGAAEVRAYVQPTSVRPNQIVNYVISIQGGTVNSEPALRFPLQLTQASPMSVAQRVDITNGQRINSTQLSWGIVASEPGEFVIPPQQVVVDGQPVMTPEVKVTVVQSGQAFPPKGTAGAPDGREPILQLELGKKEIYQGEVVPLNCTLYVPREVPLRRLGLIDIEKTDFAIARFPQQSEQTSTVIDGIGYHVLTFRSTLSSLRAGDLQVGPAKMEILVEVPLDGGQQRQMLPPGFPQVFFGSSEPRKLVVQSPPVRLKVLPLPTEGKPAGFGGAVGDFNITATASPTDLVVGDPLSVDMIVSGSGNFDALPTPALVQPSGWRLYDAKRYGIEGNLDQNMPPTVERKIGYSQVMVPNAVHPALPPLELSFFSPTEKKYVTLRTAAIPLTMRPAAAPPPGSDTPAATTAATAPPPAVKPQADITDIVVMPSPNAKWLMPPGTLLVNSRNFWTLQVVPVGILVFAAIIALIRRRREARHAGAAGELRDAWSSLEASDANDTEFLRRAAQFIIKAHAGKPVTDPNLNAILDRYQSANFSTASASTLARNERQDVLNKLAPLVRRSGVAVILVAGLLLGGPGAGYAQETKPVAVARAATADEVYRQAVQEIEKGSFTKAQYLAESLTKKKPPQLSAEVFELIGHARYRQDDMGRAALWYQRAQLLDTRSPELRQNLRHLREKLGFITFEARSPLTELSYWFGPNEWVVIAAGGLWLMLLALAWRVLAGKRGFGWVIALSVIGLLVAIPAATFATLRVPGPERVKDLGVVVLPEVQAYTAATVTSGSVIDLPPGSQVRMLERRGSWVYVEIPNEPERLRGWVEVPALAPLWIWEPELLP